jgi:protein-disulfide isomerase
MLFRLLMAAVVIVGIYTGWRLWAVHDAYATIREAPQGQSVGPARAKVTMVEFMDYRCPPCRSLNGVVQAVIEKHPDLRVVFRHYPVYKEPSVHDSQIAMAAGMQGKFKPMHDILIAREEPVKDEELSSLCAQTGVDCARLQKDMRNPALMRTLRRTINAAMILGIQATPTFIINNHVYTTAYGMPTVEQFDSLIAAAAGK